MTKARILVIDNSPGVTGALHSIMRSSTYLKSTFTFIFLIPLGSTARKELEALGFEVHELDMREIRRNAWALVTYVPRLIANVGAVTRMLRRLNIDLICNNDFYNLIPPVYRLLGGNIPYVTHVRFIPSHFPAPLVSLWLALHRKFAAKVVAVSKVVLRELRGLENAVVIANELPQVNVSYQQSTNKTILYPANFTRGKGQEYALQVFSRLWQRNREWTLRFVGGTFGLQKNREFLEELQQWAAQNNVGNVEWGMFAERMDIEYGNASIVLNFSNSESFSMTCLEAMFYGRAVLATRSGGPQEIIDNNETGVLVEKANLTEMEAQLERLMTDEEFRIRVGRQAYGATRVRFSNQNTAEVLKEVYLKALDRI